MPAYFIAHGTVKDQSKLDQYIAGSAPFVAAAGGELVATGNVHAVLVGDHAHQRVTVFKFPDIAAARAWFDTAGYQALKPLRTDAADFTFLIFEDISGNG